MFVQLSQRATVIEKEVNYPVFGKSERRVHACAQSTHSLSSTIEVELSFFCVRMVASEGLVLVG